MFREIHWDEAIATEVKKGDLKGYEVQSWN